MTNVPDNFNYAAYFGYKSVAAAVILAIAYIPLAIYFPYAFFKNRSRTFITLSLFCLIRVTAYIMRAVMADSEAVGEDLDVYIADQVLFAAGFLGLLMAAYSLVLSRETRLRKTLEDTDSTPGFSMRLPIVRVQLFRIVGMVAVACSIVSATKATDDPDSAATYRKISTVLFFVLSVVQAIQAALLIIKERQHPGQFAWTGLDDKFGVKHGALVLAAISTLLLVREVFFVATMSDTTRQFDEAYWYPFSALTEILCALLFATPGLIMPRAMEQELAMGNLPK